MNCAELQPIDGSRELNLVRDGRTVSRIRLSVLDLPADSVHFPEGLRLGLLTVGRHFDQTAQRWFVEHATEAGWDEDRVEMSCFLARLYRTVCLKRRVLTSHDILGRGYGWGRAAIAGVTARMEGSAWERVMALYPTDSSGGDDASTSSDEALKLQYDDLLIWRSPWLQPLGTGPTDPLNKEDLALAQHLRAWDARVRIEMEHACLATRDLRAGEIDALDDDAATAEYLRFHAEYQAKLKEHLQDVKRGRVTGGIGDRQRLARLLWQGRLEFLWRWDRAAEAVHRALLACDQVTRREADLFALLHVNFWPIANTVARVDEVMKEFLLFGEAGEWSALRAAIAGYVFNEDGARQDLRLRFGAYLSVLQTYLELQRAEDREAKTKERTAGAEVIDIAEPPEVPSERIGLGVLDWEDVGDLPVVQEALSELSSEERRLIMRTRIAGLTRAEAAEIAGVSRATVTRAEKQMTQILRRRFRQ